jgi:hypothetical protein
MGINVGVTSFPPAFIHFIKLARYVGVSSRILKTFLLPLCYLWLFYMCLAKLHATALDLLWLFTSLYLEICPLLGYYAASCGNCLPTFRDNVSVPSSRVKGPSREERKPATCMLLILFHFMSYHNSDLFDLFQSFEPLFSYMYTVRTCLLRPVRL